MSTQYQCPHCKGEFHASEFHWCYTRKVWVSAPGERAHELQQHAERLATIYELRGYKP